MKGLMNTIGVLLVIASLAVGGAILWRDQQLPPIVANGNGKHETVTAYEKTEKYVSGSAKSAKELLEARRPAEAAKRVVQARSETRARRPYRKAQRQPARLQRAPTRYEDDWVRKAFGR